MKFQIGRAAAVVLAGTMIGMLQPVGSCAGETPQKIVVIGDSVSTGKGLDNPAASYVNMVGAYYNAQVVNLARDECTSGDLLVMLDDPAVQAELASADMILCTVGIQDIMEPFNAQLDIYRDQLGFESIPDLYAASRSDLVVSDDDLSSYSLVLADCLQLNEISCRDNILAIGEKLSVYSSNAEIICPNVYNALDCIEGLSGMTMARQTAYKSIMKPCGFVLEDSVNAAYTTLGEQYGFKIVNTYKGFAGRAYDYTYLYYMDYNPTVPGHHWIAEAITGIQLEDVTEPIVTVTLGDLTGDHEVNSVDAAELLILAAQVGAGESGLLTPAVKAVADVNGDGDVNAVDAADILQYAATVGSGESITPEAFFRK